MSRDTSTGSRTDSVRAVDRMINILQVFSFETPELTLQQICMMTDLPKTTVFRILGTMEQRNLVLQDKETGKYRLGYELIKMGSIAQTGNSLQRIAKEDMEQVTQETAQTCNLYIRDGFVRRCIAQVEGTQYVRRFSFLGAQYPLYCGAGKLLLAYADDDFKKQYFDTVRIERHTDQTVVDHQSLLKDLEKIRRDGYSATKGERDPLTAMVAVPIYDYTEKVIASLTVSGPIYLFTDENIEEFRKHLQKAADNLSRRLGSTLK